MEIRVLVADNHPISLEGLVSILDKQPNIEVVGTAETAQDAVAGIKKHNPDVVILNTSTNGIAIGRIAQEVGTTKLLPISYEVAADFVLTALRDGAYGFIPFGLSKQELWDAIKRVHAGEHFIHPKFHRIVANGIRSSNVRPRLLSKREQQVLSLAAEGKTMKVIGHDLNISLGTVKSHLSHIYAILEVTDRAAAVAKAIKLGIITPS